MEKYRRRFDKEFKRTVAEEIISGTISIAAASRKHNVAYQVIKRWKEGYELGQLDNEPTRESGWEKRVSQLEQMLGRLTMENEFLKKAIKLTHKQKKQKEYLLKKTRNSSDPSERGVS